MQRAPLIDGADAGPLSSLWATLASRLFTINDWKVVHREKHKVEVGEIGPARAQLAAFDKDRRRALGERVTDASTEKEAAEVTR